MKWLMVLSTLCWSASAIAGINLGVHQGQSGDVSEDRWRQLSVAAQHRWQLWQFKISTGWLQRQGADQQPSGQADTWLTARYWHKATWMGQRWQSQIRYKVATADDSKALGSGADEQELRLRAMKPMGDMWLWYQAGYRWRQSSQRYDMQDGALWGAGLYKAPVSLSYGGRQASQPGSGSRHHLTLAWQFKQSQWRWTPYARIGNADSAAVGMTLRF